MRVMKSVFVFLSLVVIFFIWGCDYGISYKEPQPLKGKDLVSFPQALMGKYKNDSLQQDVIITNELAIKIKKTKIALPKTVIDTTRQCRLIGDKLFIDEVKEAVPVILKNDSVFGTIPESDTVFDMNKNCKLRHLDRYYFLNIPKPDCTWVSIRLQKINNRDLEFAIIPGNVDFNSLNRITNISRADHYSNEKDTTSNRIISPTKEELKKLINYGLFETRQRYIKD
jgi:hypothetical protein